MGIDRSKLREMNKKSVEENFSRDSSISNAVDAVIKKAEEADIKTPEYTPEPELTIQEDAPVRQEMQIHPGKRKKPRATKLLYLTDKADENMRRVSKKNNISANELVNQLLEQLN